MEKSIFQIFNKCRCLLKGVLPAFVLLFFHLGFSQIFISNSTSIIISGDAYISSIQKNETLVYISQNTEVKNIDVLSNVKLIVSTPQKQFPDKKKTIAHSSFDKTKIERKAKDLKTQPENNDFNFKESGSDQNLVTSGARFSSAVIINSQYHKMVCGTSIETTYILHNRFLVLKLPFFYFLEKSDVHLVDSYRIRPPPPFYS